jgi:hypothetical protein
MTLWDKTKLGMGLCAATILLVVNAALRRSSILSLMRCLPQNSRRLLVANDPSRAGRSHTCRPAWCLMQTANSKIRMSVTGQ